MGPQFGDSAEGPTAECGSLGDAVAVRRLAQSMTVAGGNLKGDF